MEVDSGGNSILIFFWQFNVYDGTSPSTNTADSNEKTVGRGIVYVAIGFNFSTACVGFLFVWKSQRNRPTVAGEIPISFLDSFLL